MNERKLLDIALAIGIISTIVPSSLTNPFWNLRSISVNVDIGSIIVVSLLIFELALSTFEPLNSFHFLIFSLS